MLKHLRIATWNSTGERSGQDAHLAEEVDRINSTRGSPHVEIVAIQEAVHPSPEEDDAAKRRGKGGAVKFPGQGGALILDRLKGGRAPFVEFKVERAAEYHAGQKRTDSSNKGYLLGWHGIGDGSLGLIESLKPVSLNPEFDGNIDKYILKFAKYDWKRRKDIADVARDIRAPIRLVFQRAGGEGNVFFYTWHNSLKMNFYQAASEDFGYSKNAGIGMFMAFVFLEESQQFQDDMTAVRADPGNLIVIAGDLNFSSSQMSDWMKGKNAVFKGFKRASSNLSHILAFSISPELNISEVGASEVKFGPHGILSAKVTW